MNARKSTSNATFSKIPPTTPAPSSRNGGELVFLYAPYALAPYASGDFTLTLERADAPELFTDAYPPD